MTQRYDAIVIGAGPGGYVAALRLAAGKQHVALVEAKYLGGTCLNVGCIPSKTILHTSEIFAAVRAGKNYGISADNLRIDLAAVIKRKNDVVKKLTGGVDALLKARKVDTYMGTGRLLDQNRVQVKLNNGDDATLEANNIIIATGSEAMVPDIFPRQRDKVMTSTEVLNLQQLPSSILIVGGGYIGCEFATFFSELGVKVTMVEMLDRLLPMTDKEISKTLTKLFTTQGLEIHTGVAVEKMEVQNGEVRTTLAEGKVCTTSLALICTGRKPLSSDLGLEQAGVKTEKGFIKIDDHCRTNVPNIFAIGDVTGKVQLAHVASRQATVAAHTILGRTDAEDYQVVPSAIYTHPEIASVGLTAEQAEQKGIKVKTAAFPMRASGIALAYDQPHGFAKIITDQDDIIIGAHLMCPHASDLIQEIAALMKAECTIHELEATIHGHPTFSESLAEAAGALLGRPLHSH